MRHRNINDSKPCLDFEPTVKRLFNLVMAIVPVCRNQSIDFQCVLNVWVLHAENIGLNVKYNTPNYNKNCRSSLPEVFLREFKGATLLKSHFGMGVLL